MILEDGGTTLYPVSKFDMGYSNDEDFANGDLIAAAPELLSALEAMVSEAEDYIAGMATDEEMLDMEALNQARKAIAKARGQ